MKKNMLTGRTACRWKQFTHKPYAVFRSLKREVSIGVLSVATLYSAGTTEAFAQNEAPLQQQTYELEEVEITGTRVPLTEKEAAKMVTVLSRADIKAAAVHSINDLLKYAVGVDVRQRGEFGIQTDISVRGGTFDQITILLNGVNITNPQTGHYSAEFPVSMDDIERVEILEGPAARVFGTSAFTGAINVVTRTGEQSHIAAHAGGGSYGYFGGGGRANYTKGGLSNQLSANFSRADGDQPNSDFRMTRGYYQGTYRSAQADVHWQAGLSNQSYGANTFYSAAFPNQYDELRRLLFSVRAETKGRIRLAPQVYWNRTRDHFQLVRGTSRGENFHLTDVYGMNLNASFSSRLGKTAFGAEFRNEGILSTKLGKPMEEDQYVNVSGQKGVQYTKKDNRTNISYYAEHNILLRHWTISLGVMANMNTALDHTYRYYPGVDVSYRPGGGWKLFASWNKALRMPTFTDLYYESENLQGNIGLKPERTQAAGIGAGYRNAFLDISTAGFYNKGKDMIDWVKYSKDDDKFHSANFGLDNMGVEFSGTLYIKRLTGGSTFLDRLSAGYAYIHQKRRDDGEVYKSNYALEYLRHKLVIRADHTIWKELHAGWAFRWQNRMGSYEKYDAAHQPTGTLTAYPSFWLADVKVYWENPVCNIFVEAANLFDRYYYDLGNIPQPGIWIKAGIKYRINL